MKRHIETKIHQWFQRLARKPLLLRGARQVGKSTLVRLFCRARGIELYEVNLEKHRRLNAIFQTLDIHKIRSALESTLGRAIRDENTLLFLDEIQETPDAIAALRYFHEEWRALAVLGAGSLLEFVLKEHDFSMPVGRVEFLHMGPMSFRETLTARGLEHLAQHLVSIEAVEKIDEVTHQTLLAEWRDYLFVGGMPEAVLEWTRAPRLNTSTQKEIRRVHRSLLDTYRADFPKYARGKSEVRLDKVLDYVAHSLGQKLKYSNISADDSARELKRSIQLLAQAKVILPAFHTQASGVPLHATADEKVSKLYLLDVGLAAAAQGVTREALDRYGSGFLVSQGQLAEQFAAQHLALLPANEGGSPTLHYWLREGKSGNGEVDFLTEIQGKIIPIEIKSGAAGSLRSLHLFCHLKNIQEAIRLDLNLPSCQELNVPLNSEPNKRARHRLQSLPIYAMEAIGK